MRRVKIALLGRPNVGKSTLFNRLIRSNRAITHDRPGVTRDRMEGFVRPRGGKQFILVDTGGVTLDAHHIAAEGPQASRGFEQEILHQAEAAVAEAAALCLVMDGKEGLTPFDEHLASYVRRSGKPTILAVNKVDGIEKEDLFLAEFHALGFPLLAVSAEHGHNVRALEEELSLMAETAANVPEDADSNAVSPEDVPDTASTAHPDAPLRLAMLGKPNAGKSSLVNALIGRERMIVSNIAGTTRDSIDIPFTDNSQEYVFIDTAGIRKRARITDTVERFSVNASIKTTTKADVTLFVVDATEGITAQDKRLIELMDERKTPFLILLNKIDLLSGDERKKLRENLKDILGFCSHVPVIPVSALKKTGLRKIIPTARDIVEQCRVRISTGRLNKAMDEVLTRHQPPVVKRVRPKFFYLTQAETEPPTFVFFVSDADRVSESYARYLEKSLRRIFGIELAPVRIRLRSSHGKGAKERRASRSETLPGSVHNPAEADS
ncbi:MAG: ribosome biogenesis GTPase Der [Desulfovibrionaceae bacterium]|nr:ribosome biogenesis GTPase Der [Desulfovibrionaceae bacterium]